MYVCVVHVIGCQQVNKAASRIFCLGKKKSFYATHAIVGGTSLKPHKIARESNN